MKKYKGMDVIGTKVIKCPQSPVSEISEKEKQIAFCNELDKLEELRQKAIAGLIYCEYYYSCSNMCEYCPYYKTQSCQETLISDCLKLLTHCNISLSMAEFEEYWTPQKENKNE